jgi:ATP-dependent RNA helicase DeaD
VGKRNAGAENIWHIYYRVHSRDRYLALKRIVDINPSIYGIIFCRTRQETKEVAHKLMHDGYNADALHGDLSQVQRDYAMERFRIRNLQLLVATDVAARGLDVNNLTHVINYNLPDDLEAYVHRSGRTGRAGKSGVSISIIHTREESKIRDLERMTRKKFEYLPVPSGREVCEKQLFNLVDRVEKTKVDKRIEEYLPVIYKKLNWLSREELIQHFFSEEFNRFLSYYETAPDLNAHAKRTGKKENVRDHTRKRNYSRFFINQGSKTGLDAKTLIGLINRVSKGDRIEIGKIDIMKKFSFFEVDNRHEALLLKALNKMRFNEQAVVVQPSKPGGNASGGSSSERKKHKRKTSQKR